MYRKEDYDKTLENVDKIKDEAAKVFKSSYEPNLMEMGKIYKDIQEYIKKKKRIVYGGFAQNLLLLAKEPKDAFYQEIDGAYFKWPDLADIEFYSPTPIADLIELTDDLYSKGYKYVNGNEAVHGATYKFHVNYVSYGDITYMPVNVYNNIPYIEVNGIRCCHPHLMMCDAYRILTDPMTSYFRLDKVITRFQKLISHYPLLEGNSKAITNLKSSSDTEKVLKFIRKKLITKSNMVVVGFLAYNYYISKETEEDLIKDIPYYEVISTNMHKDAKHIDRHLKHKFGKDITTKEYVNFFQFFDKKIEYYYKNNLVLVLYGNNDRCIVYKYSEKKKIHYGTFNLVFMYMLFRYIYAYVNRDNELKELMTIMLYNLNMSRNRYLKANNITVVDESPFQDFTLKCYGTPIDPIRASRIERTEKYEKGKLVQYRYNPNGKPGVAPEYKFANCSGNPVINEKNLLLKN